MKTIRNKSRRPIRVPLPGSKALHLGPGKAGQISDQASGAPALQRLVEAGEIEILDGGAHGGASEGGSSPLHAETHGHGKSSVIRPKGNR